MSVCCVTGRENFLANEWKHTRQWMQESLKKSIEDEEQAKDVDIVDIYDHLSYSEYKVRANSDRLSMTTYLYCICLYNMMLFCTVGKHQEGHTVFQRLATEWYDHVLNYM